MILGKTGKNRSENDSQEIITRFPLNTWEIVGSLMGNHVKDVK